MNHPLYFLRIMYANGSQDELPFYQYSAVRDFYRHRVSYSGGRILRVECNMHGGDVRAIWDTSWTDESKAAGLCS